MGDFAAIVTFLMLVYVRPQEWVSGFETLRPVRLVMMWAMVAMFARSFPRPVRVRDFFSSPNDYAMWALFVWMAYVTPPAWDTFNENKSLLVFYLASANILTDRNRIESFLWWWVAMILVVCVLGIGVEYGFDPTHARDRMDYMMKGRLVLGMSIFNNPNALGHAIAPLAPMLYYLMVWRRPLSLRVMALALFPLPALCVYFTESKGAYISSAFALTGGMVFGRPRIVQIALLVVAASVGGQLLYSLPRMDVLRANRASAREGGIEGRIFAFKYGWDIYHRNAKGIGKGHFVDAIERARGWAKAAHSVYVEVGAELGATGLFIYLSILYFSIKTLCLARCGSIQEERIRRALMGAYLAFCMSGWMVTFAYRAHFFFQAGMVTAFHRLLLRKGRDETEIEEQPEGMDSLIGTCDPPSPSPLYCAPGQGRFAQRNGYMAVVTDVPTVPPGIRKDWSRLTVFDVVALLVINKAVLMIWWYAIKHM